MVIMTAKLSKGKLIAALLLILAVVIAAVLVCRSEPSPPDSAGMNAATNEDRLTFLAGYGWSVKTDPVQTQQVRIPTEPSEVFARYNQLQQTQGFDLSAYAGQTVTRYVYEVLNYEAVPSAAAAVAPEAGFAPGSATEDALQTAAQSQTGAAAPEDPEAPSDPMPAAPTQGSAAYYATLLVSGDTVIGGDIAAADPTGLMHGFAKP